MKRFLSLKVQTDSLDVDPYEITTWRPIGPNTPIAALPGSLRGKRFRGLWDMHDKNDDGETGNGRTRKCNTEAEVMALFPLVARKEIRTPIPRKTPEELRRDYLYLEKCIINYENRNTVMLKSPTVSFIHPSDCEKCGLLRVESPTFVGKSKPIPATPSPSDQVVTYVPTKKLLDLKKPKSGVYINEDELANCDQNLLGPHEPRQVQQYIKERKLSTFLVTEENGQLYATVEKKPKCFKPSRAKGTQVLFDFKKIIRGNTHIANMCKEARGWHALSVTATAFTYSKMTDPRLWTTETVDDIIKTGLSFSNTWSEPVEDELINGLPLAFDFKGFRIRIGLQPNVTVGDLAPALTYVCSDLCRAITRAFNEDTKSKGIFVETADFVFIVWRKEELYCLFDPFARDQYGNDTSHDDGCACVMLNNRLTEICQTIYSNLTKLMVAPNINFRLHQIVVQQVDKVIYANIFKDTPMIVNETRMVRTSTINQVTSKMNIVNEIRMARTSIAFNQSTSKMYIPLTSHGVRSVPANELSELSLVGFRKKRKIVKPVTSIIPMIKPDDPANLLLGASNEIPIDAIGLDTIITAQAIEATLDQVLDRIQDKIDAKCYRDTTDGSQQGPRARSVLVKSDIGCLQRLRRNIIRGYDNDICDDTPNDILRNQIENVENVDFRDMPDGSQVMLATRNLLQVVEYNESISVVAPLLACVLSTKYGIHTWQTSCLDFVLNTTRYFQDCVPINKYQMFHAQNNDFPDIQIGTARYRPSVKCLAVGTIFTVGEMLKTALTESNRLVVSSMVFNGAVFRRNEFWYLFDAFPCDLVGFRCTDISDGVASLQRFKTFSGLVNRIMYNQYVGRMDQRCSVSRVSVKDVTDQTGLTKSFRFEPLPEYKEKETIDRLNKEEGERIERNAQYLEELNQLIKSEKCRIKKFNKKAGIQAPPGDNRDLLRGKRPPTDYGEEGEEGDEAEEPVKEELPADKPPGESIYDEILKQPYGYACVSPHFFFKIQGSTCLSYRFRYRADGVRACHFCSMYAMSLMALQCSWDFWNFRTVDQCIEEGRQIYDNLESVDHMRKRVLDRVTINQQNFKITIEQQVQLIDPLPFEMLKQPIEENRLFNALNKFFEKQRYVLLHFPNTTFAVIKQNCFNLFDPYASHELREHERHIMLSRKPRTQKMLFTDNNSASWLCMPSLLKLIRYVRQRVRPRDLNERFALYTIKCIASEPPLKGGHFGQFMMEYALRNSLTERSMSFESLAKSVPDEETYWLTAYPSMLPWSRQHIRNTMDKVRYKPASIWKSFDCEIDGDLYSLFANLHPMCAAFSPTYRGRQYAGIYAIAACIAALYPLDEWNQQLMNYIVVEGDRYFETKMSAITQPEYEVTLEDLAGHVQLASFNADIDIEPVVFGKLYSNRGTEFNLKKALLYFFSEPTRAFGVIQCLRKSVAFGRTTQNQYFMYDCMTVGPPVFRAWEGAAYLLLCSTLKRLLHCIVLTLRVPCYNVDFHLHEISTIVTPTPDPESDEEEEDEEDGDEEKDVRKASVIRRKSNGVANPKVNVSKYKK